MKGSRLVQCSKHERQQAGAAGKHERQEPGLVGKHETQVQAVKGKSARQKAGSKIQAEVLAQGLPCAMLAQDSIA